mgnify:CR=1 FL=1
MLTIYHHTNAEKRPAWRSAYEIKMAALEHDKRRFYMTQEYAGLARPQATHLREDRLPGWLPLIKLPLRLLANLMG